MKKKYSKPQEEADVPPPLVYPDSRMPPPKRPVDSPLALRYVGDSIDLWALFVNVLSIVFVYELLHLIFMRRSGNPWVITALPLIIIWVIVACVYQNLGVQVEGRKAVVFTDNLSRILVIYTQGFHFVPWYYSREEDVIDFQKHHLLSCSRKDGTEIHFNSKDGYGIVAELDDLFSLRDGHETLCRSLNYKIEDLRRWTLAIIIGRLSDLGACNSYESLLYYKMEVASWVANIFDGEDATSPYEWDTGTSVKNPILKDLDLSEEDKKTFGVKSKIGVIADGVKALIDANIPPEEAAIIAQAAEGAATRNIQTFQGLPKDASIIAFGDSGVATLKKSASEKKGDK